MSAVAFCPGERATCMPGTNWPRCGTRAISAASMTGLVCAGASSFRLAPRGVDDKDARFLQGLAFAALAFHFTQNRNQDGARLLADDALAVLPEYGPAHLGVETGSVLKSLRALRPMLEDLDHRSRLPDAAARSRQTDLSTWRLDDRRSASSFCTPLGEERRGTVRGARLHA